MKSIAPLFLLLFVVLLYSCSGSSGTIKILDFKSDSVKNLHDTISTEFNNGRIPILYYTADWCAPCKKIAKSIEEGNVDKYNDITLIRIDEAYAKEGSESPVWKKYRIRSIPSILVVDESFNRINRSNRRKWETPNQKLQPFLEDLYPPKTKEELAAKEKKESQNRRRNALQNAFKNDESISIIGRSTHNTSVFEMKKAELAPEMTKVHSLEEYNNLSNEDKTKTTYLSIYGTGEEAKDLIKKLGNFSQFPNLIAMSFSGDLNIPNAIFKLTKLKFLSIGNDQLEISPLIGKLTNLELLEFKYKYYTLPNEIRYLTKLKYFRAHFKISYDPSALFSLTKLKALHLEVNRKENLEGIGNLKDLEYLQISHEHPEINQLTKLKVLKIERVKNAPFENLKDLETIILSSNTLESMPESLTKLPKLAFIYSNNLKRLKVIPQSYASMPALKYYFDSYYGERAQISIPKKLANMEHYVEYSSI